LVFQSLQKNTKLEITLPDGAFYLFVGVKKFLRAGEDSLSFAQRLLEEAKVAVVPGTPFGEPEFIRLSFATDEKTLVEGCHRIVSYLDRS
jgi:aspartate aminotransferase